MIFKRKVTKQDGNSKVCIPKEAIEYLGWEDIEHVSIEIMEDCVIIRKFVKREVK